MEMLERNLPQCNHSSRLRIQTYKAMKLKASTVWARLPALELEKSLAVKTTATSQRYEKTM